MPNLAAQIREQLDTWQPTSILEAPETLTEAEFADLRARFQAAQQATNQLKLIEIPPSRFDLMRRALLGVLEWHQPMEIGDPDDPGHICGSCRYFTSEWPCPTVSEIGEKLGIEAT